MAEKKEEVAMTFEQMQKFIETLIDKQGEKQLEAIKELKEPYVSEKDKENARLAKERFAANEKQDRLYREYKQKRCPHVRGEDRKSVMFRIRNVHPLPKDGMIPYTIFCSRCGIQYRNYDPETGEYVNSTEFNYWFAQPTSTVQA